MSVEYKNFVKGLDETALALEISSKRDVLARFDTLFAALRETGAAPEDETVAASAKARVELRLAERELSKRGEVPYGESPSDWEISSEDAAKDDVVE